MSSTTFDVVVLEDVGRLKTDGPSVVRSHETRFSRWLSAPAKGPRDGPVSRLRRIFICIFWVVIRG